MQVKHAPALVFFALTAFVGCTSPSAIDDPIAPGTENIQQVAYVALLYRKEHGKLPDSMDAIREYNGATPSTDMWGNEIYYVVDGDEFSIFAAGPDGKLDTQDDVKAILSSSDGTAPSDANSG